MADRDAPDALDALITAVKGGDLGRVRALVAGNFLLASQRLQNGESPLMVAAYRGHHEIVETLIDAGAELDGFAAAATGRIDALRSQLSDATVNAYAYDGWTPLHLAAFFGQLECAMLLLDRGADVQAVSHNSMANTPLHAAAAGRHGGIALVLLEHGADPDAADAGGYTARQIAEQNGLQEAVRAMATGRRSGAPGG